MPPLTLLIKPASGLCNMRCKYCFYADVARLREIDSYGFMRDETLENLVRRAFAYADEAISFIFQGGEPTLTGLAYYQRLVRLVNSHNTRGLRVQYAVQTNGYDISDELLQFFQDKQFLLGISLDGPVEVHDLYRLDAQSTPTFRRVRRTISRIQAYGIAYNVLCVVTAKLAKQPLEVWESLAPHRYLQFIPCLDGLDVLDVLDGLDGRDAGFSPSCEDYEYFLKETFHLYAKAFRGGQGISVRTFDNYIQMLRGLPPENCAMTGRCSSNFVVESDGSVYPCDFYVLDEWRLGNVNQTSFMRMQKGETVKRFVEPSIRKAPECEECKWLFLCRNGCRRERAAAKQDEATLNRYCKAYQGFFEECFSELKWLAEH